MNRYDKLKSPITGSSPGNVLAQLLRDLITDLNYLPFMEILVTDYVKRTNANGGVLSRGAVDETILSEDMTWKRYMNILINILRVDNLTVTTSVKLPNFTATATITPTFRQIREELPDLTKNPKPTKRRKRAPKKE